METNIVLKLKEEEKKISEYLQTLPAEIAIRSEVEFDNANNIAKTIHSMVKSAEATRVVLVTPLNDQVTSINSKIKAVKLPLENLEKTFKLAMVAFREQVEAENREKILEAQQKQREEQQRLLDEANQQRQSVVELENAANIARENARNAATLEERIQAMDAANLAEMALIENSMATQVATATSDVIDPDVVLLNTKGQSIVTTYTATVESMPLFLSWVLRSGMFNLIDVKLKEIERQVSSSKGKQTFEGIAIESRKDMRLRD